MDVYSKLNPIVFTGDYSQVSVLRKFSTEQEDMQAMFIFLHRVIEVMTSLISEPVAAGFSSSQLGPC